MSDEVEERGQLGVSGALGGLFGSLIEFGQERENLLWGQGVKVSFAELGGDPGKDGLVGSGSVFFE